MKVYLSSYKFGKKYSKLIEWIEQYGKEIAVIPNAMDIINDQDKINLNTKYEIYDLENLGFEPTAIPLNNYFNKKDDLKKEIEKYNAFYVIGGNVFTLRKAMYLSGLDECLKEISNSDNVLYIGYSAGACVLGPTLEGFDIVDDPIDVYNNGKAIYDGISLIDYVPVPHYRPFDIMDDVVNYLKEKNIEYKTISDGDIIIDDTRNQKIKTLNIK